MVDLLSKSEYYPFGIVIDELSYNLGNNRYGFGGTHEMDNEVKGGVGNHLSFGDFGYDTRVGRRFNLDPIDQIFISNYAGFGNNPISNIDPTGYEWYKGTDGSMNYDNRITNQEDAMLDFAEGFVGNLAGAGIGELMSKYGASAIAKGLARIGFDYKTLTGMMGGGLKHINLTLGNVTSTRMIKGWSNKVAVIGRNMDKRVKVFAKGLREQGIDALVWTGWDNNLTDDENLENNTKWVNKLKNEGYTIYDTGLDPDYTEEGDYSKGKFYEMETKEIFGDD